MIFFPHQCTLYILLGVNNNKGREGGGGEAGMKGREGKGREGEE